MQQFLFNMPLFFQWLVFHYILNPDFGYMLQLSCKQSWDLICGSFQLFPFGSFLYSSTQLLVDSLLSYIVSQVTLRIFSKNHRLKELGFAETYFLRGSAYYPETTIPTVKHGDDSIMERVTFGHSLLLRIIPSLPRHSLLKVVLPDCLPGRDAWSLFWVQGSGHPTICWAQSHPNHGQISLQHNYNQTTTHI